MLLLLPPENNKDVVAALRGNAQQTTALLSYREQPHATCLPCELPPTTFNCSSTSHALPPSPAGARDSAAVQEPTSESDPFQL